MILAVILLVVGICLSAFFSGTETGFYRVTRVRLLLDGLGGSLIARGLLWFTNHPSLFVATTLIGNNIANYLVSLAIVLVVHRLPMVQTFWAELVIPIALSPLVFVYGELLPKNLFFHAPNLLLRRSGPMFLLVSVVLAPLSALLWLLGRVLQGLAGESPTRVRLALARQELRGVLEEGHEAGLLRPAQRALAHGLFTVATRPVREFCTPLGRAAVVRQDMSRSEVLRLARRQGVPEVLVESTDRSRQLVGYLRIFDITLREDEELPVPNPLPVLSANETHIAALIHLQTIGQPLALVVDAGNHPVGIVSIKRLTEPLFRAG